MEWFKVYHGLPENKSLRVVAARSGARMCEVVAVWLCVLDAASRNSTRGKCRLDAEEVAVTQGMDFETAEKILQGLVDKNLMDETGQITNWNYLQNKKAPSQEAERKREQREKAKEEKAAGHVRTCPDGSGRKGDKSQQKREEKKREEENKDKEEDIYTEGECEREKSAATGAAKKKNENTPREDGRAHPTTRQEVRGEKRIAEEMRGIWNSLVQSRIGHGKPTPMTDKRKTLLLKRFRDDFHQDMEAWRHYCEVIARSDYLLGKKGDGFVVNLTWAVDGTDRVVDVLDGTYGGGHVPQPHHQCQIDALREPWGRFVDAARRSLGDALYHSWIAPLVLAGQSPGADGLVWKVRCRSQFVRNWITQHYLADLQRLAGEALAQPVTIDLVLGDAPMFNPDSPAIAQAAIH